MIRTVYMTSSGLIANFQGRSNPHFIGELVICLLAFTPVPCPFLLLLCLIFQGTTYPRSPCQSPFGWLQPVGGTVWVFWLTLCPASGGILCKAVSPWFLWRPPAPGSDQSHGFLPGSSTGRVWPPPTAVNLWVASPCPFASSALTTSLTTRSLC